MNATATLTTARFYVARIDRSYRVIDSTTDQRVRTLNTRAKAEEHAAKLNRQEELSTKAADTAQAAEDAVTAVYARFAANRDAQVTTDPAEFAVIAQRAAALDLLPTEDDAEATEGPTAPAVQRIPLGYLPERTAKKAAPAKAVREPAPEPTSQIGKGVVRFTLTTEEAGTVAYTSGSQIKRDYAKAIAEGHRAVIRTIKGHIICQH